MPESEFVVISGNRKLTRKHNNWLRQYGYILLYGWYARTFLRNISYKSETPVSPFTNRGEPTQYLD